MRWNLVVTAVGLACLCGSAPRALFAQSDSSRSVTWWVNFGLGAGSDADEGTKMAGNVSANLRYAHALVTLHTCGVTELLGSGSEDYGILFGFASGEAMTCFSLAAGVASVRRNEGGLFSRRVSRTVGFPVELQWFYRPWSWFGAGLCAFGVFSDFRPFGGLTLSIQAGMLR